MYVYVFFCYWWFLVISCCNLHFEERSFDWDLWTHYNISNRGRRHVSSHPTLLLLPKIPFLMPLHCFQVHPFRTDNPCRSAVCVSAYIYGTGVWSLPCVERSTNDRTRHVLISTLQQSNLYVSGSSIFFLWHMSWNTIYAIFMHRSQDRAFQAFCCFGGRFWSGNLTPLVLRLSCWHLYTAWHYLSILSFCHEVFDGSHVSISSLFHQEH